jgi:hypothetical protein
MWWSALRPAVTAVATPTPPAQTAGRDEKGPPDPGQLDQRAVGLAQEHPAEGEPAEGPCHADGLGQGAGGHEGGRPSPPRRGEPPRRPRRRAPRPG